MTKSNMIRDYYSELGTTFDLYQSLNPSWGSLHIVLDDGNISRGDIAWCWSYAIEKGDYLGAFLCDVLLQFTDKQLKQLEEDWADYSMSEVLMWIAAEGVK